MNLLVLTYLGCLTFPTGIASASAPGLFRAQEDSVHVPRSVFLFVRRAVETVRRSLNIQIRAKRPPPPPPPRIEVP